MKAELDDSQPIFQQIADIIANEIVEGNLGEEEKIPSENELSEFYSVNRPTVRKGIQFLVDQEIIYKQRGIGMFVTKGARSILLKENHPFSLLWKVSDALRFAGYFHENWDMKTAEKLLKIFKLDEKKEISNLSFHIVNNLIMSRVVDCKTDQNQECIICLHAALF